MENRITFYQGSWFEPLAADCSLTAMVSNPPYIPTDILNSLQPEVLYHEPAAALDGGKDGLEYIRTLADQAPHYLIRGGLWIVETMAGQGKAVQNLLAQTGHYQDIQIHPRSGGVGSLCHGVQTLVARLPGRQLGVR